MGKYDDIINLPHHVLKKHHQMSLEARSAQFAPFAAVAGVEDDIVEAEKTNQTKKNTEDALNAFIEVV